MTWKERVWVIYNELRSPHFPSLCQHNQRHRQRLLRFKQTVLKLHCCRVAKRSLQASCTVLGVLIVLTILSTHWVLLSHTTCDWQVAVRSETFVYSECYKHPHLLFIMIYNFTQTYQHKRDWAMPELVKHRNADRSRPKELEPAYAHLIIIQLHFLFKHVGNLLRRYFLFFQKN